MAAEKVPCRSRWIALSSSSPTATPQKASQTFQLAARSASNGNASGTLTVTYTDGSTSTATIGFSDWTLGGGGAQPAFGNRIVLSTPYRNASGSDPQPIRTMVFGTNPITLDAGKTVASVTLPSNVGGGALHVFAIGIGA